MAVPYHVIRGAEEFPSTRAAHGAVAFTAGPIPNV